MNKEEKIKTAVMINEAPEKGSAIIDRKEEPILEPEIEEIHKLY